MRMLLSGWLGAEKVSKNDTNGHRLMAKCQSMPSACRGCCHGEEKMPSLSGDSQWLVVQFLQLLPGPSRRSGAGKLAGEAAVAG